MSGGGTCEGLRLSERLSNKGAEVAKGGAQIMASGRVRPGLNLLVVPKRVGSRGAGVNDEVILGRLGMGFAWKDCPRNLAKRYTLSQLISGNSDE